MDDIRDCFQTDRLSLLAQDRETWKMLIKNALDTSGNLWTATVDAFQCYLLRRVHPKCLAAAVKRVS